MFLFMWGARSLGVSFEFFNVLDDAFEDFNITHLYYAKIRDQKTVPAEQNIVLVNIGKLGRRDIAEQINLINAHKPKVIGIDVRFFGLREDDPIGDFLFEQALKNTENMVLVSELNFPNAKQQTWDTLLLPPPEFLQHVTTGYANIGNKESVNFPFWGTIPPKDKLTNGQEEHCFAAKVMEAYDPKLAEAFMKRGKEEEIIYFKGNLDKYPKLEFYEIAEGKFSPDMIAGKIVLMGYMGDGYRTHFFDEDKFYTPLNEVLIGRSTPDMFGVVIHANILSMILEDKYINEMPVWLSLLVAVLICYINITLFAQIIYNPKLAVWYNGISKLIQLIEVLCLYLATLLIFDLFKYQTDFTLAVFVVILSGDLCEIYIDVILNLFKRLQLKLNF